MLESGSPDYIEKMDFYSLDVVFLRGIGPYSAYLSWFLQGAQNYVNTDGNIP